jgi:hypothetical protein
LRYAGIGDCELEELFVDFDGPVGVAGATFDSVSIADVLVALKAESVRWVRFAERGRPEQIAAIRESAIVLRSALSPLTGELLTDRFKLDAERGGRVAARIDRMVGYVLSVLDAILGHPVARALSDDRGDDGDGPSSGSSGRGGRGRKGRKGGNKRKGGTPPGDTAAMPA